MKILTIGNMTLKQLQEGMKLQEQIRIAEKELIRLNNPTNRKTSLVLRIGENESHMEADVKAMAIEITRLRLESRLRYLKAQLEKL